MEEIKSVEEDAQTLSVGEGDTEKNVGLSLLIEEGAGEPRRDILKPE